MGGALLDRHVLGRRLAVVRLARPGRRRRGAHALRRRARQHIARALLDNAPLRWLGLVSFGVYLWHLPILHWLLYWGWPLLSSLPAGRDLLAWLPLEPDYLRYPWIGDLSRMQSQPGLIPQWSAGESVRRFVEQQRSQRYQRPAEEQPYADDQLERVMAQRRPPASASIPVEVL